MFRQKYSIRFKVRNGSQVIHSGIREQCAFTLGRAMMAVAKSVSRAHCSAVVSFDIDGGFVKELYLGKDGGTFMCTRDKT